MSGDVNIKEIDQDLRFDDVNIKKLTNIESAYIYMGAWLRNTTEDSIMNIIDM